MIENPDLYTEYQTRLHQSIKRDGEITTEEWKVAVTAARAEAEREAQR